jgi:hypothetical protein
MSLSSLLWVRLLEWRLLQLWEHLKIVLVLPLWDCVMDGLLVVLLLMAPMSMLPSLEP